MKHQFKWSMEAEEFDRLRSVSTAATEEERYNVYSGNDYFGAVYVGDLCCEFMHTFDRECWFPFVNIYALGIDDGYGYTKKNQTPYTLLDWDFSPRNIVSLSFEDFKAEFEKQFSEELEKHPEDNKLATRPLGDWT